MDPPLKVVVRSTGLFAVIIGVIHTSWYFLREKYVPKEEKSHTPIIYMIERLLGVNKGEKK